MNAPDPGSVTLMIDDLASSSSNAREEAARRIWERYGPRLLELVRRRLDHRLGPRVDAEDVAQSAYLSFCMGTDGDHRVTDRTELWRFLATITIRKVCNAVNHHRAIRRDYRREARLEPDASRVSEDLLRVDPGDRSTPGPEEVAVVAEVIQGLPTAELQRIALWRLEGFTNDEIAQKINRTTRSVEIKMRRIRECLSSREVD